MTEIRNKIEESGLIQLDLSQFKPTIPMVELDLADQLWQGLVLREQDFRSWIKSHDWSNYKGKAVCVFCSADAIVPTWAFMLVAASLNGLAEHITVGRKDDLEKELIQSAISNFNANGMKDGRIIIKGCSDIKDPAFAMVCLLNKIQSTSQSIMYGEPCSTVPIFKRSKVKDEN